LLLQVLLYSGVWRRQADLYVAGDRHGSIRRFCSIRMADSGYSHGSAGRKVRGRCVGSRRRDHTDRCAASGDAIHAPDHRHVLAVRDSCGECGEFPSRTAAFAGATVMVTALGVGGGSGGGPKKLGGTAEPTAAQPHRYAAIPSRRQTDSSGPKSARRIFSMTVEIVLVIFYL
jgi:hypothetical protein